MVLVRSEISSRTLPPAMINGLVYALINRSITAAGYIRITGRSKNSATRDLLVAEHQGFLDASGQTRGRVFRLGPRFAAGVIRPT